MAQKIKSFCLFLKRRGFLLFLFVLFLIFFFPRPTLAAGWLDRLLGGFLILPMRLLALILWFVGMAASEILLLASTILNWTTSADFIPISYTRPGYDIAAGENPIIAIGLGFTQGLVNMILVLILVFIALATILRLREYETQKLLVTFIIVALLVNFAPLICGLIIDPANIVMNFFLGQQSGLSRFGNQAKSIFDSVFAGIDWRTWGVTTEISRVAMMIVLLAFSLAATVVFWMFIFLFLARRVAIWILVILAPLAFACYILPITRGFFRRWWSHFIQWTLVGVTASFFLALAEQLVRYTPQIAGVGMPGTLGLGGAILPYLVPLAFLYFGVIASLQSGAYGAGAIIAGAKAGGKAVGLRTAKATARGFTKARKEIASQYTAARLAGAGRMGGGLLALGRSARRGGIAAWASFRHPFAPSGIIRAAGRGSWNVARDMAIAGVVAGLGIKLPKKERPTCPKCGNFVPAGAKFCPHCKAPMPVCPNPKCNKPVTAGATFCHRCGTRI